MPANILKDTVVITDTSCFIILQKIDAINLLQSLFSLVITTPEIAREYGKPLPPWIKLVAVTNLPLQEKFRSEVDTGEASAIALAFEIDHDYIIIDDLQARKFAEKQNIKVKGTLGILLKAKLNGTIPLLKPYLENLQQTNFRISQKLIQQILNAAGE